MTATTTQTNPNWLQRLQRRYSDAPKRVAYGYPKGTEAETVSYPDGTRVIDVAIWNEFGTERDGKQHIPPRPFLASTVDDVNKQCQPILDQSVVVLNEGNTERYDQLLDTAGSLAAGILKQRIIDLREPPNAPRTIKKKGSSNPLYDTGLLAQSATYKILDKE